MVGREEVSLCEDAKGEDEREKEFCVKGVWY